MASTKQSVLITGCSDGGLGAALAVAFHNAGLKVYATARNPSKMKELQAMGIETLTLDVLDGDSITKAVGQVKELDILVNNAGAFQAMPIADLSIAKVKELFDLNVWSHLAVTQAFLPLIIKSKGIIVNHTSCVSAISLPFHSPYNASKAAIASFSESLRFEMMPFDVRVVDLKSGAVHSHITEGPKPELPQNSVYAPARDDVQKAIALEEFGKSAMERDVWAKAVVADLLKKSPPAVIWRGHQAWLVRLGSMLPHGFMDGAIKKTAGLNIIAEKVKAAVGSS